MSNRGGARTILGTPEPVVALNIGTFAAVGAFPGYEETATHIEGDFAYVTWKMTGIAFATDTFVIRDGKIVLQTAALFFG